MNYINLHANDIPLNVIGYHAHRHLTFIQSKFIGGVHSLADVIAGVAKMFMLLAPNSPVKGQNEHTNDQKTRNKKSTMSERIQSTTQTTLYEQPKCNLCVYTPKQNTRNEM